MPVYAVIDTNILVSALLKYDSVPGRIVRAVFTGKIIPLLHEEIVAEYNDVLRRKKFKFKRSVVRTTVNSFKKLGIRFPAETIGSRLPDEKDEIFYSVVCSARKTLPAYLVTGNTKHFPTEPFVLTPAEMLDIIEEAEE